nr:ribonuclease H-like domain, reverse transcriptase, RNA-dependent DNA polymerase [Tanacetum cinerariifolium]
QAGKEEADRLGLAFPSLNLILGVATPSIGSFISAGSTPPVSAGSTPQMSSCASPISADRHSSAAGKSPISASRPVFAGRPTDLFLLATQLVLMVDLFLLRRNNHPDFQLCMFSYFLSQEEPTTVAQALADPAWVEAIQAEM